MQLPEMYCPECGGNGLQSVFWKVQICPNCQTAFRAIRWTRNGEYEFQVLPDYARGLEAMKKAPP